MSNHGSLNGADRAHENPFAGRARREPRFGALLFALVAVAPALGCAVSTEVDGHRDDALSGSLVPPVFKPWPRPTLDPEMLVDISAGGDHTCVRKLNGKMYCWGRNDFEQVGTSNTTCSGLSCATRPLQVATASQIELGYDHTCMPPPRTASPCTPQRARAHSTTRDARRFYVTCFVPRSRKSASNRSRAAWCASRLRRRNLRRRHGSAQPPVQYAGVLAPASRWRSRIAPAAPAPPEPKQDNEAHATRRTSRYRPWAELLKRTFGIDVLECPTCPRPHEAARHRHRPRKRPSLPAQRRRVH